MSALNISFYTAAVGAQQQQERLNVHGNNIANVNTYGFRARKPSFTALMTGPIAGIDEPLARGVGSRLEEAEPDFREYGYYGTDRPLDYAIEGHGFFALVDPTTGEFSYTRDGSFTMSQYKRPRTGADGQVQLDEFGQQLVDEVWYLSDGLGRFVLGRDGGPIAVSNPQMGVELPVGIFDFINYNGMIHVGENRLVPVAKNGQVRLAQANLVQGCLELSNADLGTELAKVIESQRSFSYMLRMVQTSDEIETTVNALR